VIFDCDGMLVDSEVISNRVLAAMLTGTLSSPRQAGVLSELGSDEAPYVSTSKGSSTVATVASLVD
jgi:beta-phosphoglucomutase-like phosphatase (HAD superfamily)